MPIARAMAPTPPPLPMISDTSMRLSVGYSHASCQAGNVGIAHTELYKLVHSYPMESIAQRLRTLREQRKVTQVEVAVAVDVDRSTISKFERGGDVPGRETLRKLARYYGVGLDWLAADTGASLDGPQKSVRTDQEALLLWAFRALPEEEAQAHLNLMISRAKSSQGTS